MFMVAVVRIDEKGFLIEIKEVSDIYRYEPYSWDQLDITTTRLSENKSPSDDK